MYKGNVNLARMRKFSRRWASFSDAKLYICTYKIKAFNIHTYKIYRVHFSMRARYQNRFTGWSSDPTWPICENYCTPVYPLGIVQTRVFVFVSNWFLFWLVSITSRNQFIVTGTDRPYVALLIVTGLPILDDTHSSLFITWYF